MTSRSGARIIAHPGAAVTPRPLEALAEREREVRSLVGESPVDAEHRLARERDAEAEAVALQEAPVVQVLDAVGDGAAVVEDAEADALDAHGVGERDAARDQVHAVLRR